MAECFCVEEGGAEEDRNCGRRFWRRSALDSQPPRSTPVPTAELRSSRVELGLPIARLSAPCPNGAYRGPYKQRPTVVPPALHAPVVLRTPGNRPRGRRWKHGSARPRRQPAPTCGL